MSLQFCSFCKVDKSDWPIVIMTLKGGPQSDEDMRLFLTEWQNVYSEAMIHNKRYKLLFDAREAGNIQPKYLMALGKWLSSVKSLSEQWMDRTAIIISNNLIRTLIKFVFNFYKAVRPFKVFSNDEIGQSVIWLKESQCNGDLGEYKSDVSLSDITQLLSQNDVDFSTNIS